MTVGIYTVLYCYYYSTQTLRVFFLKFKKKDYVEHAQEEATKRAMASSSRRKLELQCPTLFRGFVIVSICVSIFQFRTISRLYKSESSQTDKHRYLESSGGASSHIESIDGVLHDALCHDCRMRPVSQNAYCGSLIKDYMDENKMNVTEAAIKVAGKYPEVCSRCHPDACTNREKILWRFDQVLLPSQSSITHYLPSIQERLPPQALSNSTAFFDNAENVHPMRTYFYEYNPSLVRLPQSQTPFVAGEEPVYLASFRVSNISNCVSHEEAVLKMIGGSWPRPPSTNYLGLALLRNDLSIIQDTILDMKQTSVKRG